MTSTRAKPVWRGDLWLVLLLAVASEATSRHKLRSSSPTKIDFWSVYEDTINRFGHIGTSTGGSLQATSSVGGQERTEVLKPVKETNDESASSQHQSKYLSRLSNPGSHITEQRPVSDEYLLANLKFKHQQDLLRHSSQTDQIGLTDQELEELRMLRDEEHLETRSDGTLGLEIPKGSVSLSSVGTRDAVTAVEKKVVKRRRKPARSPRPRLTVTDGGVDVSADDSVSEQPGVSNRPRPTNGEDLQQGSNDEGTNEEGADDEGTNEEGTNEEGGDEEGADEEGTTDENTTEIIMNGSVDSDTTDVSNSEDFTTDNTIANNDNSIGNTTNNNNNSSININNNSMESSNSSGTAAQQQLSDPEQLWPNSQDADDGSGADLAAGVIDSIIASVIKIQGNFNDTFPDDSSTNSSDYLYDDYGTAKFKSPLLTFPNETDYFDADSTPNESETATEVVEDHLRNDDSVLVLGVAPTDDLGPSLDEKPTEPGTEENSTGDADSDTPVVAVPRPAVAPFKPPVRTNLFVLSQAGGGASSSSSSSSSSVQSEGELSQFDYVVRAIQNPSRMTAAVLDVANTVGVVGGIMSLPFLIPLIGGRRRRRRDVQFGFSLFDQLEDGDLDFSLPRPRKFVLRE